VIGGKTEFGQLAIEREFAEARGFGQVVAEGDAFVVSAGNEGERARGRGGLAQFDAQLVEPVGHGAPLAEGVVPRGVARRRPGPGDLGGRAEDGAVGEGEA